MQQAHLICAKLHYLCNHDDVRMRTESRVYCGAVCPALLYSCKIKQLKVVDIRMLQVFDQCYVEIIGCVLCCHDTSNIEVHHRVLGRRGKPSPECLGYSADKAVAYTLKRRLIETEATLSY
ncbi:unnamed protein product [Heterobilharzia americana]|nr:unnamed protein product [Heterobilharzia americana]CAH8633207.1 unnamed protein product [Heterobilharzia americana]